MKKLLTLLFCLFLICAVNASQSTITTNIDGMTGGALIAHASHETESSGNSLGFITGNENWQQNTAGSHVVALGDSQYSESAKINNKYRNTYDIKNELIYNGGAAIGNQYTVTDNKAYIPDLECTAGSVPNADSYVGPNGTQIVNGQNPSHQSVSVRYSGTTAGGGRYKTGSVVDDANLTTSIRAEGAYGGVSVDYSDIVEAGFNNSAPEVNFRKIDYGHYSAYSHNGSGYYLPFDLVHKDYSNPFETSSISFGNEANQTINQT